MTSPHAIAEPDEPGIPEGFKRLDAGGPYFPQMGPVYTRRSSDGQTAVLALRVAANHPSTSRAWPMAACSFAD